MNKERMDKERMNEEPMNKEPKNKESDTFSIIKPVLEKADAKQLTNIEKHCPVC